MSYRHQETAREENGIRARKIKGMISRRQFYLAQSRMNGQVQAATGRQAEDGSFEEDEVPVCQPVGLVANPHEYSAVESITAFVGADGNHPVSVNTIDHRKWEAIEKAGLDKDETIVYTSVSIVKIYRDGHVEIRKLDGTAVPLATKADVEAVNARVEALQSYINSLVLVVAGAVPASPGVPVLAGPPGVPGGSPPASTSATVDGTTVLKAQ